MTSQNEIMTYEQECNIWITKQRDVYTRIKGMYLRMLFGGKCTSPRDHTDYVIHSMCVTCRQDATSLAAELGWIPKEQVLK
jgi:hypothetical protein